MEGAEMTDGAKARQKLLRSLLEELQRRGKTHYNRFAVRWAIETGLTEEKVEEHLDLLHRAGYIQLVREDGELWIIPTGNHGTHTHKIKTHDNFEFKSIAEIHKIYY